VRFWDPDWPSAHPPAGLSEFAAAQGHKIGSVQHHLPGGWLNQPVNAAYQGTFPRAGRADDGHDLGQINFKADALQRFGTGPVLFSQINNF